MPGRAEAVGGDPVAQVAQLGLGAAAPAQVDDLGAEPLPAEAGVLVRLGPAKPVVDVEGGHAEAQAAEHVPEAGRVGAARDEAGDLAAGGDQVERAHVRVDA